MKFEELKRQMRGGKELFMIADDTVEGIYPRSSYMTNARLQLGLGREERATRKDVLDYLRQWDMTDCFEDVCLVCMDGTRIIYGVREDRTEFRDYEITDEMDLEEKFPEHIGRLRYGPDTETRIRELLGGELGVLEANLVQDAQPINGKYSRFFITYHKMGLWVEFVLKASSIPVNHLEFHYADY